MRVRSWGFADGETTRLSRRFFLLKRRRFGRVLFQFALYIFFFFSSVRCHCVSGLLTLFCRHGRDHKLIVWQVREKDESDLSTALPLDGSTEDRPNPWMLHFLEVNTANFCSFTACPAEETTSCTRFLGSASEILIAVPNTLASEAVCFVSPASCLMACG